MRILIKTLGCKSNRYESDRLVELLGDFAEVEEINEGAGRFQENVPADILVVNTCTVTHMADRKSRQAIRSFKRIQPEAKILVFGCGANVSKEDYLNMNEVDYIAQNVDEALLLLRKLHDEEFFESCEYERSSVSGLRTRALIKIQDGCNNYCTYCIIPRARGAEYSFPSKQILSEAKRREDAGFKEIVLTGINIGEWKEEGKELADLFELLIKNTSDVRFRVSSIEPKNFSQKFFELFESGRLCPHIHMSLQSGSDSVLERMKRNYKSAEFLDICEKFRKFVPDMGLTTDVIVGFPGESEAEFGETYKFMEEIGFLKAHVFPYSKRKNTAAYYMKDHISEELKKERASKLRLLSEKSGEIFKKSSLGKIHEVLIEKIDEGVASGFAGNYIPVKFACEKDFKNEFVQVKLEKLLKNGTVWAELT